MSASGIDQLLEKGDALYEANQWEESIEVFDAVLRQEPANLSALSFKVKALTELGRIESAIACYDDAIAADPSNAKILAEKARTLGWLGHQGSALEAVARAIDLDPANPEYRAQQIGLLRRAERFEEALSACDTMLRQAPAASARWVVLKAEILRDLKRFDAAFDTLCGATVDFAASEWTSWADTLRREDNHGEALRYYKMALKLDAKLASAWHGMGRSLSAERRLEEALAAYTRAAEAKPANALWLVDTGNVYFELKKFDNAVSCYNEALTVEPGNQYALVNLGVVAENLGEYTKAIEYHKRALETDPNFLDAVVALAASLDAIGESSDALQAYDRALTLRRDCYRALNGKGYILQRQGQQEQAIELFDQALASPDREGSCTAWTNKSSALRELGRYDECETFLREALAGADAAERAQLLPALGTFLAEIRLQEIEAHECFLEVHRLTNGSADAKANLAESLLRLGRYPEAREYALAAGAVYGEAPVGCAIRFLVLASHLLEGDLESSKTVFEKFESNLRAHGQAVVKGGWDFTGLTAIAANPAVEPMIRFLLLTLIDLQTGKLSFGSSSFFQAALTANTAARAAASPAPR